MNKNGQQERLKQLVKHAYQNSPAFRERLDSLSLKPQDIQEIKDLEKLPVVRQDELVELQRANPPFGNLLAVDSRHLLRIFQSPGPIYDPQGRSEDYWRWGEPLKHAGFGEGDIVINTFSYHLSPAGFMFDDGLMLFQKKNGNKKLQQNCSCSGSLNHFRGDFNVSIFT